MEKIDWIKTLVNKSFKDLKVMKNERKFHFLRNKFGIKHGRRIAVLNRGFRFVIHLVSDESHKNDLKSKEIKKYWEDKGFVVFFIESFNDKDFYNQINNIKEHKIKEKPRLEKEIKELETK